jgi:uncharacterized RDD family membrane protein YckC
MAYDLYVFPFLDRLERLSIWLLVAALAGLCSWLGCHLLFSPAPWWVSVLGIATVLGFGMMLGVVATMYLCHLELRRQGQDNLMEQAD